MVTAASANHLPGRVMATCSGGGDGARLRPHRVLYNAALEEWIEAYRG